MGASLGKRVLKWTLLGLPWLLALLLAAGWALTAWTPGYLEELVPRMAADMGLPLTEFHIRDAGLFSADIGPVRLGPEDGGVRLANVHVTYTPASLKQGRVNAVILDGVVLGCAWDGEKFTLPAMDLIPASEGGNEYRSLPELPLSRLEIRDSRLECAIEGKGFTLPFSVTVTPGDRLEFQGKVIPRDQTVRFKGTLGPTLDDLTANVSAQGFRLGALADLLPLPVGGEAELVADATVNLADLDTLKAELRATVKTPILPDTGVTLEEGATLDLQATVSGQTVDFSLAPVRLSAPQPAIFTIESGHAEQNALSVDASVETMGIRLPVSFTAKRNGEQWDVDLASSSTERLALQTGGRTIRLAGLDLSLAGTASPEAADVVLKASTRGASLEGVDARTGTVRLSLPLKWPAPKRHAAGSLSIANIRYGKYAVGKISAKLRQEGMGLSLDGSLATGLLPGLRASLSGKASMETREAEFAFDVPAYALPEGFDPAGLAPALKDVALSGNLSAEGGLHIRDGNIDSRLGVFLTGGSLVMGKEGGTRIDGIRLYFESPDLIDFRSAPAQLLAFDSLSAGPVSVGKGVVTFQLEPRGVVLVERMEFDWCDGHVASRAFRVVPGHEEYDITLFCSELKLSKLLGQLGLAEAKGQAALSGELPVTWKRGKISFHNGFLHSTPGEGGTIQVEAMEDLVSAIPEGTPQRGQIELAKEAIKDFDYKWVRIKADSVGDELLVRLSVDGKPASTLPFIYRREFGGFMRVTGDVKGSNFQGLRLDVNFSLPLDRILLYKDVINMIE
ncbi:hypothetical protein GM415_02000 [Pseudodesulfovibrio cashew]|uniref:Uncharacterized protein n=1 Tax=Pseudodesulfovibrio cashew TaxID=2678688 RepID=A0A6I6JFZ7_9BACT|nr:YdbH domain-containing protein [Pseudodesulfovibrio cashew]QGY38957.1 hypothetical protein GM415_02000 [Pseudodesulfovibrio cashew]